jgi:hypothetical protein
MPRQTRSVPAYRKHRASGQAVVSLNHHDYYLGPFGSRASRLEYDRLIGEWLQQGRRISPLGDAHANELTVIKVIVSYLNFANSYYRKYGHPTSEYAAMLQADRSWRTFCLVHPWVNERRFSLGGGESRREASFICTLGPY